MLFEDPEMYPCLLSRLDERPPAYVIYGYTWDVDDKHFRDYAAPIDRYIRSRYAIEFTTDGYEIWKRLESVPQAAGAYPRACQPRRFRISDLVLARARGDAQVVLHALHAVGGLGDRHGLGLRGGRLDGAVQRRRMLFVTSMSMSLSSSTVFQSAMYCA